MTTVKGILPVAVLCAGLFGVWCLLTRQPPVNTQAAPAEPPWVQSQVMQEEAKTLSVHSQGVVQPRTEMQLVAEVPGRVVRIHPAFAAGGFFAANEVLVHLDTADADLAVTKAHAAVAEARKDLQRELAEVQQARHEWRALGGGKPSAYMLHLPQLNERRAKLAAAQASLEEARLQRRRCDLSVPFAGRVREKKVDVGQYVVTGEALARLFATDFAEVRLPIISEQLALLDLPLTYRDGPAQHSWPRVTLSARVGDRVHQWPARIVRTEGALDEQTSILHAVARIDDPYRYTPDRPPLWAGQFVHADIEGVSRAGLYAISAKALYRGTSRVVVVNAEQRLQFREVTVLLREGSKAWVTEGLHVGDRVIVGGVDLPIEGMRVRYETVPDAVAKGNE